MLADQMVRAFQSKCVSPTSTTVKFDGAHQEGAVQPQAQFPMPTSASARMEGSKGMLFSRRPYLSMAGSAYVGGGCGFPAQGDPWGFEESRCCHPFGDALKGSELFKPPDQLCCSSTATGVRPISLRI